MAEIQVNIVEGRNFTKHDWFSDNDAFVQIYLDEKEKQKTNVQRNSKTPHWNQTFSFNHIEGQDILHIGVYDKDLIINNKIGLLQIDLHDLYEKGHIDNWYNLPKPHGVSSDGEIHLILDYKPLQI